MIKEQEDERLRQNNKVYSFLNGLKFFAPSPSGSFIHSSARMHMPMLFFSFIKR